MVVSVFAYDWMDKIIVRVTVMSRDEEGHMSEQLVATDTVPRPSWIEDYPQDWVQLVGDRVLAMAFRDAPLRGQLPPSHDASAAPQPGPEPSPL